MFRKRLCVYLENQDLLTIAQHDFAALGRQFVEKELRSQRLIEFYCEMCEKLETSKSYLYLGQALKYELNKEDKITEDEVTMILEECT